MDATPCTRSAGVRLKSNTAPTARAVRSLPLVLDWDGTVTERDTLHMTVERFGDVKVFAELEAAASQSVLSLDEVIGREMATIKAPLAEVVAWLLTEVRVRRGFRELVEELDPLIVSAGFHELIEPILEREGIEARVIANHLRETDDGLQAVFNEGAACVTCSERCKRGSVGGLERFAYVGDGLSDRCVALAAERIFARTGLARWLDAQGAAYEPYDDLLDVRAALERS